MTNNPPKTIWYLCIDRTGGNIGSASKLQFSGSDIADLCKAITEECLDIRALLAHARHLTIWKVKNDVANLDSDEFIERVKTFKFSKASEDVEKLGPKRKVDKLGLDPEETLLVQVPGQSRAEDEEARDRVMELPAIQRRNEMLSAIRNESISIRSAADVEKAHHHLFMGRVIGRFGHSVALFHPLLAKLQCDIERIVMQGQPVLQARDLELLPVSKDFVKSARQFHPTERVYWSTISPFFTTTFAAHQAKVEHYSNEAGVKGSNRVDASFGDVVFCEIKKHFGLLGDPTLQAGVWFAKRCWSMKDENKGSKMPCILLAVMGNVLEISIAVCLEEVIVNKILHFTICEDQHKAETINKLAMIASALRDCAAKLQDEYDRFQNRNPQPPNVESETWQLPCPTVISSPGTRMLSSPYIHFVPSANTPTVSPPNTATIPSADTLTVSSPDASTVPSPDTPPVFITDTVRLQFKAKLGRDNKKLTTLTGDPLEMRSLFLADYFSLNEREETVVKFAVKYDADAHHHLAEHNYAPKLHACVPVLGRMQMVVMERVKGRRMFDEPRRSLPRSAFEDLKKAVMILHDEDYVFGDLRDTNVMIVTDSDPMLVLIDFDWTAKEKVALYPSDINEDLFNVNNDLAPDIVAGGPMLKKHDKWALANLIDLYCADQKYRDSTRLELKMAEGYELPVRRI